jgi:hypothetical protein
MSKEEAVLEGIVGVGCVGAGILALPSLAGAAPLFGLGALLLHNARAHLTK